MEKYRKIKTVHRLVSTDETKKVYPFDFAFTVNLETFRQKP